MHRRPLSLILTLMVSTSLLSAEVWESNALSMRLKPAAEILPSGYSLVVEDDAEYLYLDGNPISEKKMTDNGYILTEGDETTIYTLDQCGRPLSIEEGSSVTRNVYSNDGLLLSSTITDSDGIERISEYHWSPEGRLMSVENVELTYYLPTTSFHYSVDDYTYSLNDETPEVFIERLGEERSKVEIQEDESVKLISPDGSERLYSREGFLVHEVRDGIIYDYIYEDGVLSSSTETDGRNLTRLIYVDGILHRKEYLVDGVVTRIQTFHDDGYMTEDRYRNGKPYARVSYDRDHKTIRSIESL